MLTKKRHGLVLGSMAALKKKKNNSILNFKHKTGNVTREGIIPLLFNYLFFFKCCSSSSKRSIDLDPE